MEEELSKLIDVIFLINSNNFLISSPTNKKLALGGLSVAPV